MIEVLLKIGMAVAVLSAIPCLYRIVFGPTFADRVVALDMLIIMSIIILTLFAVAENKTAYLDSVLSLAVLSFVGTIALARYLEKGSIL
jgi:multisubunit Na+/H+ antiporter MnhF subunit